MRLGGCWRRPRSGFRATASSLTGWCHWPARTPGAIRTGAIRKGKPGSPTQFGATLLICQDERGFIGDHRIQRGNPPDAPQLVPALQRVMAVTGTPPATVVADRGFGTAANDQAVQALGVRRVGLQPKGTVRAARAALERTRACRRLRNWRVGSRRASATASAQLGCAAPAPAAAPAWCQDLGGLGIFADNLQRLTVIAGR